MKSNSSLVVAAIGCVAFGTMFSTTAFADTQQTVPSAITSLLNDYFSERSAAVTSGLNTSTPKFASLISKVPVAELQAENLRPRAIRRVFDLNGGVLKSDTETYTVNGFNISGNTATLQAYVWDAEDWLYKGAPITSGFGTGHTIQLQQNGNGWVIVSDIYDEGPLGVNTQHPEIASQALEHPGLGESQMDQGQRNHAWLPINSRGQSVTPNGGVIDEYQAQYAAQYADQYVYHSANGGLYPSYYNNAAYVNMNSLGGDCANYSSQSAINGNLPAVNFGQSSGWWYDNKQTPSTSDDTWSTSWSNSPALYNFMLGSTGYGVPADPNTPSSITLGAMEFIKWHSADAAIDHTCFVAAIVNGEPLIDSHNADWYHEPYKYGYSDSVYYVVDLHYYVQTP